MCVGGLEGLEEQRGRFLEEFSEEKRKKMETKPWAICSAQSTLSSRLTEVSAKENPGKEGLWGIPSPHPFFSNLGFTSPGFPGTRFIDQAGLELRDFPASASSVLGLKACTTTAQLGNNTLEATLCLNFIL